MKKQTISQTKKPGQLWQVIRLLWVALWFLSMTTMAMAQFTGYGDGSDGDITISTTTNADDIRATIAPTYSGSSIINITISPNGFANGDLILIIDMLACEGGTNWEFNRIDTRNGNTINLDYSLISDYQSAQIIRVPEYSNVTINAGASVTCHPWDPEGGTGGVIPLMVSGTLTIEGTIDASAKGFAPGAPGGGGIGRLGHSGAEPGNNATPPPMGGQGIGSAGDGGQANNNLNFGDDPENPGNRVCGWSIDGKAQNSSLMNPTQKRILMGASGCSGKGGAGGGGGGGAGGDANDCITTAQKGGDGDAGNSGGSGGLGGKGGGIILIKAKHNVFENEVGIMANGGNGNTGSTGGKGGNGGQPNADMGAGAGNGGNGGSGGKGAGGGAGGAIYIVSIDNVYASQVSLKGGTGNEGGLGGAKGTSSPNAELDYITNGCPCPLTLCACEEVWEFMNGATCSQVGDFEYLYEKAGISSCLATFTNGGFNIVCTDLSSNPPCDYQCDMEQISPAHPMIFAMGCLSELCENTGPVPSNFDECYHTCDDVYLFKNTCCQGDPPVLIKRVEPVDGNPGEDGLPGDDGDDGFFSSGCEIIIDCPDDLLLTCPIDSPYELPDGDPMGGTYEGVGIEQQGNLFYFSTNCENIPVGGSQDFEITYTYNYPETGCSGSCTFIISVHNPDIIIPECLGDFTVCPFDDVDMDFCGVIFNPYYKPVGIYEINYSCAGIECTSFVTVEGIPVLECPPFDIEVCIDDPPFFIGSIYLDPASLGEGVHYLNCSITNSCGTYEAWNPDVVHRVTVFQPGAYVCKDITLCDNAEPRWHCGVWIDPSEVCNPGWVGHCSQVFPFVDYLAPCGEIIDGSFTVNIVLCCEPWPYPFVIEDIEWQIVSIPIQPFPPDIDVVFEPAIDLNQLSVVLSNTGIFWPSGSINTIGNWDVYQGYKIKMNAPGAIYSIGAMPEDKTISLNAGANYMPVLSAEYYPANDIFDQLGSGLIFAYDLGSESLYWPQGGLYALDVLEPGKGYLVGMSQSGQATYDPLLKSDFKDYLPVKPKVYENAPWKVNKSGSPHLISIDRTALSEFDIGDFIGVFNAEGMCAGMSQIDKSESNLLLVAYGNDFTEKTAKGLADGETMEFNVYRASTMDETHATVSFDASMPNMGLFAENGLSKIMKIKTGATSVGEAVLSDIHIYPNPSDGTFTIMGMEESVRVKIFNLLGNQIYFNELDLPSKLDISSHPKGIYFICIKNDKYMQFQKLILK